MEKEVLEKLRPLIESEISEELDRSVDKCQDPEREKKRRCNVLNSIGMNRLLKLLSPLSITLTLKWNDIVLKEITWP